MDNRTYFAVGDLVANMVAGTLIGIACWLLVSTGWNMFLAMVIAMIVGMILSLPISLFFVAPYGAMEVMLPVMLTGMVSGMVVGMWEAMKPLTFLEASLLGLVSGVGTIIVIWIVNARMKGIKRSVSIAVSASEQGGE